MKILYVGRRKIVSEILKKAVEQTENDFIQVDNPDDVDAQYEMIFVDYEISDELCEKEDIDFEDIVIMASSYDDVDDDIECEVLRTPFLPSEVASIIQSRYESRDMSIKNEDTESLGVDILDPEEIDIVKSFLKDVEDEDLSKNDSEESMVLTPEELIDLIMRLKVKKIRKILEGAKIELKITFPKERE